MSVVEHIDVHAADHDAFVAALDAARHLWLGARGCRSVEVTRGGEGGRDYRVRVDWRSRADRDAFDATDAGKQAHAKLAAFEERGRHVHERLPLSPRVGLPSFDGKVLRKMFGHHAAGVVFVTAMGRGEGGEPSPAGMLVTSFTSVSLAPPLVSFYAAHTSSTWPVLADAGACAVNLLAASQRELCEALATKKVGRFDGVAWRPAASSGAPILDGVAAWLDCRIAGVSHAGDHDLVLLEVMGTSEPSEIEPLVFHRSAYRRLTALEGG